MAAEYRKKRPTFEYAKMNKLVTTVPTMLIQIIPTRIVKNFTGFIDERKLLTFICEMSCMFF
jgi:hypothetical protein